MTEPDPIPAAVKALDALLGAIDGNPTRTSLVEKIFAPEIKSPDFFI